MSEAVKKILIITEGENTEVNLMKHLFSVYGFDKEYAIVPYKTNVYALYNEMFKDGEDPSMIDVQQLLKTRTKENAERAILDEVYTDILLIFDLDPQDPDFMPAKIRRLPGHFQESSDMGKLYVNYPMVESFYHMKSIPDEEYSKRMATLAELKAGTYKKRVNLESHYHNYRKFATTKKECNTVIKQNIEKARELVQNKPLYLDKASQRDILNAQLELLRKDECISILCTCVLFISEYNSAYIQ